MCKPMPHSPAGSLPDKQSRAGRPSASRFRRVTLLLGDAGQPDGQPVGQQAFLRFDEAALDTFREGLLAASDPQGSEAEGAQAHPAPNPYQALGLVGR